MTSQSMGLPINRERAWRAAALLLVAGMHVWIGWALVRFHPEPMPTKSFASTPPDGTLLVLTFTSAGNVEPAVASAHASDPARRDIVAKPGRRSTGHGPAAVSVEPEMRNAPLNLAIAPDDARSRYQPDIFQHQRALDYEATRFANAWQAEGNLVDVVASRSSVAGAILGALGALTKPCTARQQSQYDPACVPPQYVHPTDGERERDFD